MEDTKPDKSRRFLSTKLWFSNSHCDGENTIFTFSSSNSAWGTIFNSLTLGLSAPLCRVYFVEMLFEGRRIEGKEEVRAFLEGLRFVQRGQQTSGEELIRWLERQVVYERRRFGFEKLQGNSFAVYLLTLPRLGGNEPDTYPLRKIAEQRYRVLDCVDNIVMLGGRVCSSITGSWGVWRLIGDYSFIIVFGHCLNSGAFSLLLLLLLTLLTLPQLLVGIAWRPAGYGLPIISH